VKPSAVPLWKVIVGPRADKLKPGPRGSGFLFAGAHGGARAAQVRQGMRSGHSSTSIERVVERLRDGAHRFRLSGLKQYLGSTTSQGKRPMAWTTPTLVEICLGLEINGYLPAEF